VQGSDLVVAPAVVLCSRLILTRVRPMMIGVVRI
jgi:hypothetical protein